MAHQVVDIRTKLPKHPFRRWKKRFEVDTIVVHCTAGSNQDPWETAKYHVAPGKENHLSKDGAPGLAYHDFINKDGTVYRCNNYTDITWHAGLYNTRSVGVVLAYLGKKDPPPSEQLLSLEEHLTYLCICFHLSPSSIIGHREVPGMYTIVGKGSKRFKKKCPGLAIDLNKLRYNVAVRMQTFLAAEGLYKGEIDGVFGKLSKAALSLYYPKEPPAWLYKDI